MQRSISFKCKSSTSSFLVLLMVVLTAVPAMFGQAYFGTVSGELTDATERRGYRGEGHPHRPGKRI